MGARLRRAFSLVELLVVIGVIGLLIGLTLPVVQRAREAAARVNCLNNLRQIGVGLHGFQNDHGHLPGSPATGALSRGDPNALLGWMAQLLPYVERDDLWARSVLACRVDPNPLHNPPHTGLACVVPLYVCPTDSRLRNPLTDNLGVQASFTSYIGIGGTLPPGARTGQLGVFGRRPARRLDHVRDGLSNTIMVGERPPPDSLQAGWWYPGFHGSAIGMRGPNNTIILGLGVLIQGDRCALRGVTFGPGRTENPCDRFHLWSFHPGGANFLFADGSVRYLPFSAEPQIMALASRSGGEVVEWPE